MGLFFGGSQAAYDRMKELGFFKANDTSGGGGTGSTTTKPDINPPGLEDYPKSWQSSRSESRSYTGPSESSWPAVQQLVNMSPAMAGKWQGAWEASQQVPGYIEAQRELVPARTIANFQNFRNYTRGPRNAYAARGLRDSTPAAAAVADERNKLFEEYNKTNLTADLGLTDALISFLSNQVTQSNQLASTAGQLADLGKISQGFSLSSSEGGSANPLARFLALLQAAS